MQPFTSSLLLNPEEVKYYLEQQLQLLKPRRPDWSLVPSSRVAFELGSVTSIRDSVGVGTPFWFFPGSQKERGTEILMKNFYMYLTIKNLSGFFFFLFFFLSSLLNYDLSLKPTPSWSSKWCILFTWHPQRFYALCEQIPHTLSSAAIPTGRNLIGSCLPFAKCRYLIIDQIRLIHSTVAMAGFYRLTFCS